MEMKFGRGGYEDIIHRKHPVSASHPQMPITDRAAQFSPFAALVGFGDAVGEAGRLTEARRELEEDAREGLDRKLKGLLQEAGGCQELAITYFQPDDKKDGGAYFKIYGKVKKVDAYGRMLLLADGTGIPFEDIVAVEEASRAGLL